MQPQATSEKNPKFLDRIKNQINSSSKFNTTATIIAISAGIASSASLVAGASVSVVALVALGGWAAASTIGVADHIYSKKKIEAHSSFKNESIETTKKQEQETARGQVIEVENPNLRSNPIAIETVQTMKNSKASLTQKPVAKPTPAAKPPVKKVSVQVR